MTQLIDLSQESFEGMSVFPDHPEITIRPMRLTKS